MAELVDSRSPGDGDKQLLDQPARTALAALLIGYLILLLTAGVFPLAGHIYVRRIGALGILYLLFALPAWLLCAFVLEWSTPTGDVLLVALGIVHLLLPVHAALLARSPRETGRGDSL